MKYDHQNWSQIKKKKKKQHTFEAYKLPPV